jgi:tetratricopeptide (TPR) repeat protein
MPFHEWVGSLFEGREDGCKMMKTSAPLISLLACLALCGCSKSSSDYGPNNSEPMYGGRYNPDTAPDMEKSRSAANLGWEYYYKGDYETAVKRFNQAWMFNRENAEVFWGFGLVQGQRAKKGNTDFYLNDSVRHLKRADNLDPKNYKIMVDLAYSHTLLGGYCSDQGSKEKAGAEFSEAQNILQKAEEINGQYALLYSGRSFLGFYSGDYEKAKIYLEKAKELGFRADPMYESELLRKLNVK